MSRTETAGWHGDGVVVGANRSGYRRISLGHSMGGLAFTVMRVRRFDGQTVVVTGAARGLGRGIAERFVQEGASVLIADVDADGADRAASELGDRALGVGVDVTDPDAVDRMVYTALDWSGRLDHAVNNAGIVRMARIVDMSDDDYQQVMNVNARGVFLCMRAELKVMLEQGHGSIVNTSSVAGKWGYALAGHYCASKAAVLLLSQNAALEAAPVARVNCVCPGIVDTELSRYEYRLESERTGEPAEAIAQRWLTGIPMKRFQRPADMAAAAAFLCSDDASEITGQALHVNGGFFMAV
jgi:meso-butanediol dehydrogenase / (S,S)-butanediol dehydrogenase / diacetyl reductase